MSALKQMIKEGWAKDRAKQKETKNLKRSHRTQRRAAVKGFREDKSLSKTERRRSIKTTRKFHKVSDKGKVGGWAAVGKYTAKVAAKIKARTARKQRKTDRKQVRTDRKTAKREARSTRKANKASMKEKVGKGTYLKQDTDFFKRNAKQRGMKLSAYYAKYVK